MNGSKGSDFKMGATDARRHSIDRQDRLNGASNLEGQARLLQQKYIGHPNVVLRNASIHAASSLNNAAHAIRLLAEKEQDHYLANLPKED